jgi:hypothetical protein
MTWAEKQEPLVWGPRRLVVSGAQWMQAQPRQVQSQQVRARQPSEQGWSEQG